MIKMINIKTPSNLYFWWNFGSLISMYMIIQIIFGLILSMNYMIKMNPFMSSFFIYYNINYGWLMRLTHSNMTSLIFLLIMIHIKRNLFFNTFFNMMMWKTGMMMMIIFMLIAFLGYSLIWTQMSYWGMMVITNFISTIPYLGKMLLNWIWGNFNINIILINRFFIIHFILPLIMMMMIIIHINILHLNKSTNPLGTKNKLDLINLNPYSIIKDMMTFMMILYLFMNLNFFLPLFLNNFDNFNEMNYFITPNHIEPEWYFLYFYSILRSIPNKLSGLIMMFSFLLLFFFLPNFNNNIIQNNKFNYFNYYNNLNLFFLMIIIAILGSKLIEYPFEQINFILINLIFLYFFLKMTNKLKKFILKMN